MKFGNTRWGLSFASLLAFGLLALVNGCPPADSEAPTCTPASTIVADDHVLGSDEAPVTVIEYGDLECPVCGRFDRDVFPTIKAEYIDTGKVRWIFRHFPLRAIHPNAEAAAQASECAADQGQFEEFKTAVFAEQSRVGDLGGVAALLGLGQGSFDACLSGGGKAARVQRDVDSGAALGVSVTPTFFICGERQPGFRSIAEFRELLDAALGGQ